ncbi:MAG: (Fe-S)-binding protein, partial [Deltaproteobacteria bacterium]
MSSLKELARLMKELEDQLVACMRCGLCQAVCPLFAETGREADVARGKLALLDGLAQEILKNPQGVSDHLNRCLLCGACAANCPSGVKALDIFIRARVILAGYMGLSPLKKAIFRGLLRKPDWFNRILAWGAKFQGIFIQPVDDLLGSSCARFMSPLLADRHFKALAPVPWHVQVPRLNTAAGASGFRVAFFVGCLIDKVLPQVGEATLKVLDHHGVGVYLPAGQGCCGIPALSSGDIQTFKDLVRLNLKILDDPDSPCDYLVTACATCSSTIKKLWPLMMQDAPAAEQERIAQLAARTLDISQFLVDQVGVAPARARGADGRIAVTYHDPCHLKKSLEVAAQPRVLLQ